MDFNCDNLIKIENILLQKVPIEIVLIISKYYLYPHQYLEKFRIYYNYVLTSIPLKRAPYCNLNPTNFLFNIYYKLKPEEILKGNFNNNKKEYDESIHISPFVYFSYPIQINQKFLYFEEITNCKLDDYEEYVKDTFEFKKKINLSTN